MTLAGIDRLLITGAAGRLGSVLRDAFAGRVPALRLSDRVELGERRHGEEHLVADLADAPAVETMLEGVDAVVHLGGQPVEADWPTVLRSNIMGCINLWEAARKAGSKRIVFASTNHAIGFHRRSTRLDHRSPARPDSRYGTSKAFGEDLALYYANKHGIRGFCMRIGSCFPEPSDERMLSTWLSYGDFVRLVEVGLVADYHYEIVYGVSANRRSWWDNSRAFALGYRPQDDAERWARRMAGRRSVVAIDEQFQGGFYCSPDFTGEIERISGVAGDP